MQTALTQQELLGYLKGQRCVLVPTMGYLHDGHLSLVRCAKEYSREHGIPSAATIFVNPTQFNESADFASYPRTLEDDLEACELRGVDVVFAPRPEVMYPPDEEVPVGDLPEVANRTSPHFGKHFPNHYQLSAASAEQETANMLDILEALQQCIDAGKIRHCGLSDDTTWGIATYLKLSKDHSLPPMVSIQNEFNLLHWKDWPYLIEHCIMENIAFLPWSPLAGGMLSGKYLNGARPEGSRWSMTQRNGLFRDTPQSALAVEAYVALANKHGITPSQLALLWCDHVDGVTSTIIGATTMAQLEEDIDAFQLEYTDELIKDILHVIKQYPAPF